MSLALKKISSFSSDLAPTLLPLTADDRNRALHVLETTPLPTTRVEAWKYTRVAKLDKIQFHNEKQEISDVKPFIIDDTACTFVFVNGHFSTKWSSQSVPKGVTCTLLSENSSIPETTLTLEGELFNALNTAHLTDGLRIDIEANAQPEHAIQLIHILKGDHVISNFKTIIRVGKSSKAAIIQGFFSDGSGTNFCNASSEISVDENASLLLEKIQFESLSSYHIATEEIQQAKNTSLSLNTLTLNGGLVRNNVHVNVNGENCETHLNGAYLLKDKQHVDNHTVIDHKAPNCNSHELYKGVIDDNSTAVFNGKVYVRPNAQKINAFQSNGNVLLSGDATINSKPELEIYADDVKCSHGSTTGQLDDEAIFYLRARGISEKSARRLMVSAFIGDVLDKIETPSVLKYAKHLLNERFEWEF